MDSSTLRQHLHRLFIHACNATCQPHTVSRGKLHQAAQLVIWECTNGTFKLLVNRYKHGRKSWRGERDMGGMPPIHNSILQWGAQYQMSPTPQILDYTCTYRQLRARMALSIFTDVPLRTRRALSLYNVYDDSTLLVLKGTSLGVVIAPSWFSTEHLWVVIAPFWLSTDDM